MQGAADKTYVDDVYSTYTYVGNGGAQQITNNVDNSKGGLVWMKNRERSTYASNLFFDTERGSTQYLVTDTQAAQATSGSGTGINTFNDNGFTLQGNGYGTNYDTEDFVSWNFREAGGFFDIVTWTGTGSAQNISHSLKCQPGMIIVKCTSAGGNWVTWHQSFPYNAGNLGYLNLNASSSINTSAIDMWNNTSPTSSVFTVGTDADTNASGETYVAYVFASGAATKQYSVKTDAGASNYMSVPTHSDLNLDGDFTVEFWHKRTTTGTTHLFSYGDASTNAGIEWYYNSSNVQKLYVNATEFEFPSWTRAPAYKWVHYAISREGTNTRVFVGGKLMTTYTSHSSTITGAIITGNQWGGSISASDGAYWSNLRVVKGTAVYTAAFTPPQSALTNITNTKLLCWNSVTTTGATVSPVTIVQNGTVTSKSDTPSYSDPECFKFGPDSDKNTIATGMYTGTGGSNVEIDLGWEPQWVLIKNTDLGSENWFILDSMRGLVTDLPDLTISTNTDQVEASVNALSLTPTGFIIDTTDDKFNGSGHDYMYMAVRRPDGYVGKPPSTGTGAFTMDYGNASPTGSNGFDSGFPVGYSFFKKPSISGTWYTCARLVQGTQWYTNLEDAAANGSGRKFDSNVGWNTNTDSDWLSYMWKRGQGFDVVTYTSTGLSGLEISHSLGQIPEMIWVKNREAADNWCVYHKGLNGGTNPQNYFAYLNTSAANISYDVWYNTAPTATHFKVNDSHLVNSDDIEKYIVMLFASANDVDGNPISKVGYYTGNGTTSGNQVTLGFQPRFLILRSTAGSNWWVFDTVRGWNGSNDKLMNLDNQDASASIGGFATPNSTGFNIITDGVGNNNAVNYIYYAHK
jgi:hypothetical protein